MRVWQVDDNFKKNFLASKLDELFRICKLIGVEPNFDVLIVECETLEEYRALTGRTYAISAVYSNGSIVTQPFDVLRSKGLLEETLLHELVHHITALNFDLPSWMQEGLILYLMGRKPEELLGYHRRCLLRFMKEVHYEEIPIFLDRHRRVPAVEHR